jgi:hypothetical protein
MQSFTPGIKWVSESDVIWQACDAVRLHLNESNAITIFINDAKIPENYLIMSLTAA